MWRNRHGEDASGLQKSSECDQLDLRTGRKVPGAWIPGQVYLGQQLIIHDTRLFLFLGYFFAFFLIMSHHDEISHPEKVAERCLVEGGGKMATKGNLRKFREMGKNFLV